MRKRPRFVLETLEGRALLTVFVVNNPNDILNPPAGQVTLRITVTAGGDIVAPEMVRGSGSDMLDNAALTIVRGGHVPAFPSDMTQAKVTLNVGVTYRLED